LNIEDNGIGFDATVLMNVNAILRSLGLRAFLGGLVVFVFAGVMAILLVKFLWLPFN
jgi:hypothetical protein